MNITKLGQSDQIFFWVAVDETGKRVVYLEDGQNLEKKCDKLINAVAPGQGTIGHNHQDYSDKNKRKEAPLRENVVE